MREGETKEGSGSNGSVLSAPSSVLSESDILALVEAASNKITKRFGNGNVYVCQMKGRKRNGYGTCTYDGEGGEEDIYIGEWKNDKRHGIGSFTWGADSAKYVGEWEDNNQHGHGTYNTTSDKYVGEYKKGNRHGYGTKTKADGTIIHQGQWINGNPSHGKTVQYSKTKQKQPEPHALPQLNIADQLIQVKQALISAKASGDMTLAKQHFQTLKLLKKQQTQQEQQDTSRPWRCGSCGYCENSFETSNCVVCLKPDYKLVAKAFLGANK